MKYPDDKVAKKMMKKAEGQMSSMNKSCGHDKRMKDMMAQERKKMNLPGTK